MSPQTLICATIAVLCFTGGWVTEHWRKDAQIATLRHQYAADLARANNDALLRLQTAQILNDRLAEQLASAENMHQKQSLEKDHAIRRLTVGRPCLDRAAVRVLNDASPNTPAVPQAGGEPLPTDATFATDTDVGTWIAVCQRGYAICNGRLGALADFYKVTPVSARADNE